MLRGDNLRIHEVVGHSSSLPEVRFYVDHLICAYNSSLNMATSVDDVGMPRLSLFVLMHLGRLLFYAGPSWKVDAVKVCTMVAVANKGGVPSRGFYLGSMWAYACLRVYSDEVGTATALAEGALNATRRGVRLTAWGGRSCSVRSGFVLRTHHGVMLFLHVVWCGWFVLRCMYYTLCVFFDSCSTPILGSRNMCTDRRT